jgi:hypothetical protein
MCNKSQAKWTVSASAKGKNSIFTTPAANEMLEMK